MAIEQQLAPQEETILVFTGESQPKRKITVITCREVSVTGWGLSLAEAIDDVRTSLVLYKDVLHNRGELTEAIADGTLPSVRALNTPESLSLIRGGISAEHIWLIPVSEHLMPIPSP